MTHNQIEVWIVGIFICIAMAGTAVALSQCKLEPPKSCEEQGLVLDCSTDYAYYDGNLYPVTSCYCVNP